MSASNYSSPILVVIWVLLAAARPLAGANTSESDRLEKLERAVELLEKQNAELQAEISSLKKHPAPVAEGKTKTQVTYDGKTYVEKTVPVERPSWEKWKIATSTTELELYGDLRLR